MAKNECNCSCCQPDADGDARERGVQERLSTKVQDRLAELEERLAKLELETAAS